MSFFEANEQDMEQRDFDPVPPGDYICEVTKLTKGVNKSKTGEIINVEFKITEGKHAKRVFFDSFNIAHTSTQAQEIGRRQFAGLCIAAGMVNSHGVAHVDDPTDLYNIPLTAKLKVRPAEGQYSASNEVVAYKVLPTGAPNTANQSANSGSGDSGASQGSKPWERNG